MLKGVQKQIIVVKTPEAELFEEAIFILREDYLERGEGTRSEVLRQARRAAEEYCTRAASECRTVPRRRFKSLRRILLKFRPRKKTGV